MRECGHLDQEVVAVGRMGRTDTILEQMHWDRQVVECGESGWGITLEQC